MFCEHSGRTNDMDTMEYATFRYDTVEMENGLNNAYGALIYFTRKVIATLSYHWKVFMQRNFTLAFYGLSVKMA